MKSKIERLAAIAVFSTVLTFVSQPMLADAQTAAPSAHATRVAARKANHELEHKVVAALEKAKIDVADIRVIAKHGEIGLAGEVAQTSQIDEAANIASQVPGVTSVKNYLSVYEEGGQ